MHTYFLTERRAAECRLSGDDVDFLLERHGKHLRLVPTRENGVFVVRPTRLVGIINAPTSRIIIRPKLPLRSFAFLLDPDAPAQEQRSACESLRDDSGLLNFLVLRLTRLLGERAVAGLQRAYRQTSSEGPFLQGRLDVAAQLRQQPRRDVLHGRHDELTADVLCNQVPRSTLEMLLRSPLINVAVRPLLAQALASVADISSVPLSLEMIAQALSDRATAAYRPLLEMCRLVTEGCQSPAGVGGPETSFLLDLERLFERWVTRGLVAEFASSEQVTLESQRLFELSPVRFRPDVIVREGDNVCLVVDAKWKRLRPGRVRPADFYQALAYASALGSPRVVLIHPGSCDDAWTIPVPRARLEVQVRTLRVTAGANRCRRSLRRLVRALSRQLF
jgi:5-methylcytosine-specific restriction endonuclease McrBC regulatory subunit McrC